jgi:hypothetical protein
MVVLAACSGGASSPSSVPKYTEEPNVTAAPDVTAAPSINQALEMYKKVLSDEIEFYSSHLDRGLTLTEYCAEETTVDDFIKYFEFAVVDIDGSGIPNVILYVGPPGINLIFSYEDGTVYGHSFGTSETKDIKTNGFFSLANSEYWGVCTLKLDGDSYEYTIHANMINWRFDDVDTQSFIGGEEVAEDKFYAYLDEIGYNDAGYAVWHEFNELNLNKYLMGLVGQG